MSYIKRMLENLGSDPEEVRRRLLRKGIQHPAQPGPGGRAAPDPAPEPYAQPRPAPYPAPGRQRRQRRTGATFPAQPRQPIDDINADLFGEER